MIEGDGAERGGEIIEVGGGCLGAGCWMIGGLWTV